jgi:hypothetical protein
MTFLALTPLQTALLAMFTAGIVIGLYFLKIRRRRVLVSSAILWRRVLEEQFAQSLWQRFRRIFSVLVAVTISLLIALSLARPQIDWLTGKAQRLVIVLDTSPSMNTFTADGHTRWQHAVDEARSLVENAGPAAEFRIAETSGDTAFGFTGSRIEAGKAIDELSPGGVEPRFPVLDGSESHVYFVSDGVAIHDIPSVVETISVFEEADNVGITAFDVRPIPSNPLDYEAYLEVDNFGAQTAIGVTLSGMEQDRITKTVSVAAGEKYREAFDLSSFHGGAVHASILAKDDALSSDNQAVAYLPARRKMRTLLVTRGNPHLQTLLKYDRNVELLVIDPANYRDMPDVDAYVFDRFAPSIQPSKPALIIGTPAASWLRSGSGVVQKPKITRWSEAHPIMQHVAMHDVSIQRVPRIDPADLTVIAASNDTPLIVASEKPKWVMLTFDLNSSDFPLQAGFPIFVHNVLAWLNDDRPATHAANPLFFNVNESVLRDKHASLQRGSWLHHELWFYMLAAAFALISVEWITYHRRITL